MNSVIDSMTSATGWAGSSVKASVQGVNEISEYVAGLNSKSLIFKFSDSPAGSYVQKSIAKDLTGFEEVVFWVWSRNKKNTGVAYNDVSQYAYKIDFGTGKEFFLPMFNTFSDVTISIKGMTNISRMRITCLHNSEDYLIVSNVVAVKDELPVDIWRSLKEQLEYDFASAYYKVSGGVNSKGISLGKISGVANDKSIIFPAVVEIAEKYSVVLITDGTNSEIHHLDAGDGQEHKFLSDYSGSKLKHNYTNADVYLTIPVEYGMGESEINLPGINIQGMSPEEIIDSSKVDHARDTFEGDESVTERLADAKFRYLILIDCEARTNEMIAFMSLVVRYFLARQILWVNGKRIDIQPESASTYIDPIEAFNQIPKIQYTMTIDVRENVFDRQKLYETIASDRTFNIRR